MKKNKGRQPDLAKANNEAYPLHGEKSAVVRQEFHIGPLPDPGTLSAYNQLIPDGANRIMIMAEKEQECSHKLRLEASAITSRDNQSYYKGFARGQWINVIVSLGLIGFAAFLANMGHLKLASAVVSGPLLIILRALCSPGSLRFISPISRSRPENKNPKNSEK